MSTDYGALFVADNGNPFIVPDNNVFSLAQKLTVSTASNSRQTIATMVPITAELIVFGHTSCGGRNDTVRFKWQAFKGTDYWQIAFVPYGAASSAQTCSFYVFANIVLNPSKPGDYGLFCFDEKGREMFNTNAKLLVTEKLYPNLPSSWPSPYPDITIGKKYACLGDIFALQLPQYESDGDYTMRLSYQTATKGGVNVVSCNSESFVRRRVISGSSQLTKPRGCLVIDCALYD